MSFRTTLWSSLFLPHLTLKQKADREAEEELPPRGPLPFHLSLLDSSLGTHQELPNPLGLKELRPHLGSWFWILLYGHSLVRGCAQRGHSKVFCFALVQVCLPGSRQGGSWAKTKGEGPVWLLCAEISNKITCHSEECGLGNKNYVLVRPSNLQIWKGDNI